MSGVYSEVLDPATNVEQVELVDGTGTKLGTAANPLRVDPTGTTTQPVSAASLPLPTGASTATLQTTGNTSLSSIDTKTPALGQALAAASTPVVLTAAQVTTLTPPTTVTVTQSTAANLNATVTGTVTANAGTNLNTSALALESGGHLASVDTKIPSNLTVTSTRLLVNGSGVTQPVSAASLPLPTGASTSTLQTTGNTSLATIVTNTTPLTQGSTTSGQSGELTLAAVTTAAPSYTTAQTSPLSLTTAGALRTDSSAVTQPVSATSLPLPTGAATSALQTTGNTSLASIDTKTAPLGQTTMVSSSPVVIASNQSAIPVTGTFTASILADRSVVTNITANGQTSAINTQGIGTAIANVTGTWVGTLQLEGTTDGTNWVIIDGITETNSVNINQITSNQTVFVAAAGFQQVRWRAIAWTSGTANVAWNAGVGTGLTQVYSTNQSAFLATVYQGTSPWVMSAASLPLPTGAATSANQATEITSLQLLDNPIGPVTPGTVATNSYLVGAQYNTAAPSLTNTQQAALQVDSAGRLIISPLSTTTLINTNAIPVDGTKSTYSASSSISFASATSATDIFTITGTASKIVRVLRVAFSATQTTAATVNVLMIKRSTANTGGTSAAATRVPHDSTDPAATATVLTYTANPTLGTAVGTMRAIKAFLPTTLIASAQEFYEFNFGHLPEKAIVLRGTGEVLALNLNATTVAGGAWTCFVQWTEE